MSPEEPIRALMIEDDPESIEIVRLCLEETDSMGLRFGLESAGTLGEGLKRLEKERFDVILLDLILPDSEGMETMLRIVKNGFDLPILIVTNLGSESLAFEAMRLGAQDYLVKSTSDSRLLKRSLWQAIERHKLRRRMEELITKAADAKAESRKRQELDRLKDELIGTVSHELRTPLAVVLGAIHNLTNGIGGALTPKQDKIAALGLRGAKRMIRIVDNLLDLSRLESGRAQADLQPISLGLQLEEAAARFGEAAQVKGLALEIEIQEGLAAVRADPDLLAEVLDNLLSNALRFARSRVALRAVPTPAKTGLGGVLVEIVNDGELIPAERIPELFDKFVQLARPHGPGYKGTGLGLSICKEILALHATTMNVESDAADGTRFGFVLHEAAPEPNARNLMPVAGSPLAWPRTVR